MPTWQSEKTEKSFDGRLPMPLNNIHFVHYLNDIQSIGELRRKFDKLKKYGGNYEKAY